MKSFIQKVLITAGFLSLAPMAAQAGPGCWTAVGANPSRCPEPTRLGFQYAVEKCTPEAVVNPEGVCLEAIQECASRYFSECAGEEPFSCTEGHRPAGSALPANRVDIFHCQDDPRPICDQKVEDEFINEVKSACPLFPLRRFGNTDLALNDAFRNRFFNPIPGGNNNPPDPSGNAPAPQNRLSGDPVFDFPVHRVAIPTKEEAPQVAALSLAGGGCSLATGPQTMPFSNLLMTLSMGLAPILVRLRKK